jgi:hypothetical protein
MEPIKAPPMESLANLTRQTEAVLGAGTNASEASGLGFGLVSTSVSESFFEESIVAIALSLSLSLSLSLRVCIALYPCADCMIV